MQDLEHTSQMTAQPERAIVPRGELPAHPSNIALPERRLLTVKEVAQELRVSTDWVRDHASGRRQPSLPHIRLGDRRGVLRFRRKDIDWFLETYTRNIGGV